MSVHTHASTVTALGDRADYPFFVDAYTARAYLVAQATDGFVNAPDAQFLISPGTVDRPFGFGTIIDEVAAPITVLIWVQLFAGITLADAYVAHFDAAGRLKMRSPVQGNSQGLALTGNRIAYRLFTNFDLVPGDTVRLQRAATMAQITAQASGNPIAAPSTFELTTVPGTSASPTEMLAGADLGSSRSVSCAALVGPIDPNVSIEVQSSADRTSWATRFGSNTTRVGKDTCIVRFPAVSARYWRVRLMPSTQGPVLLSHLVFGNYTVMERPFFSGFAPIITPTQIDLHTNVSVGGNLIGSSYSSSGATIDFTASNLSPLFARETMLPVLETWNTGNPLFFAWRPMSNSEDSYYIWRGAQGSVVTPAYSGVNDLMDLSFSGRVYYR